MARKKKKPKTDWLEVAERISVIVAAILDSVYIIWQFIKG